MANIITYTIDKYKKELGFEIAYAQTDLRTDLSRVGLEKLDQIAKDKQEKLLRLARERLQKEYPNASAEIERDYAILKSELHPKLAAITEEIQKRSAQSPGEADYEELGRVLPPWEFNKTDEGRIA